MANFTVRVSFTKRWGPIVTCSTPPWNRRAFTPDHGR